MKKLILLAFVALMGAAACADKGDTFYITEGAQTQTATITVNANEWEWFDNGEQAFYRVEKSAPIITNNVFRNGMVQMYFSFTDGGLQVQQPLPFVSWIAYGDIIYSETIDFDFWQGNVMIYYKISDFIPFDNGPGSLSFRLVVVH
ncbi:MAG: hypothetical protein FWE10_03085 [Rikenellaceae bacterium]|nr:hypothetical protein [Rikenellaceae bacterium]MCL2693145.1 hypothetical protein [Rikenellaceae bacterium]